MNGYHHQYQRKDDVYDAINYTRFRNINDDDDDEDVAVARREATRIIQDAMEMLPLQEKAAYLEACDRAPRLVATESDPSLFLRFEKNNAEAAAHRLARYWRLRRDAFGIDRAFRPMMDDNNLHSGDGALSQQDVALFRIGWLLRLPNDKKNRPVLYFDRSKRTPGACGHSARRIAFFAFQSCFSNKRDGGDDRGVVLMLNLSNPSGTPEKDNVKFLIQLFHDLPISLYQLHVVCRPPGGTLEHCTSLKTIVAQQQDGLRECFGKLLCFHVATSDDDCIVRLSAHDLSKDCLPVIFGGSWADGCSSWRPGYNSQLHLNIEPDPKCLIRNTLWYYIHSRQPPAAAAENRAANNTGGSTASTQLVRNGQKKRIPPKRGPPPAAAAAAPQNAAAEEKEKMDKKQKIRVQHKIDSRKRRTRLKIEEEVHLEQYWKQRHLNESLKAEKERLEALVQAAQAVTIGSPSSP